MASQSELMANPVMLPSSSSTTLDTDPTCSLMASEAPRLAIWTVPPRAFQRNIPGLPVARASSQPSWIRLAPSDALLEICRPISETVWEASSMNFLGFVISVPTPFRADAPALSVVPATWRPTASRSDAPFFKPSKKPMAARSLL